MFLGRNVLKALKKIIIFQIQTAFIRPLDIKND